MQDSLMADKSAKDLLDYSAKVKAMNMKKRMGKTGTFKGGSFNEDSKGDRQFKSLEKGVIMPFFP